VVGFFKKEEGGKSAKKSYTLNPQVEKKEKKSLGASVEKGEETKKSGLSQKPRGLKDRQRRWAAI